MPRKQGKAKTPAVATTQLPTEIDTDQLTPLQINALQQLYTVGVLPNKKCDLAEAMGTNRMTLWHWFNNNLFLHEFYKTCRLMAGGRSPWVVQSLADKAEAGDIGAQRLFLELTGLKSDSGSGKQQTAIQINFGEIG